MSCTPDRSPREARMLRAIGHAVFRNHQYDLSCDGCLEILGFATVKGYDGDGDNPVCGEALGPNDAYAPLDEEAPEGEMSVQQQLDEQGHTCGRGQSIPESSACAACEVEQEMLPHA